MKSPTTHMVHKAACLQLRYVACMLMSSYASHNVLNMNPMPPNPMLCPEIGRRARRRRGRGRPSPASCKRTLRARSAMEIGYMRGQTFQRQDQNVVAEMSLYKTSQTRCSAAGRGEVFQRNADDGIGGQAVAFGCDWKRLPRTTATTT